MNAVFLLQTLSSLISISNLVCIEEQGQLLITKNWKLQNKTDENDETKYPTHPFVSPADLSLSVYSI